MQGLTLPVRHSLPGLPLPRCNRRCCMRLAQAQACRQAQLDRQVCFWHRLGCTWAPVCEMIALQLAWPA